MLNISTGLCFYYGSILPYSGSGFPTWNIHTRGTNCEDVIPGIAFGPCSSLRGHKMKENAYPWGPSSSPSLARPSSTPYADRSTGFQPRISWKFAGRGFDRISRPPGLVRNSTCASRARVTLAKRSESAEKLFAEGRRDAIRWHKARNISDCGNDESWNWRTKLREAIPMPMRAENVSANVYSLLFLRNSYCNCASFRSMQNFFFFPDVL